MIITISGKAGSGKSTVAKIIAKELGLSHYSVGDVMREMAADKKMTLLELNKIAETDKSIDLELDERLKKMGEEKDDFVVDGRLTAFFIPHANARVFLDAKDDVRAKRILGDMRKDEINEDLKSAMDNIEKRELSEKKRYKKYYHVDYMDTELYNLVIDTSEMAPQQVARAIVEFVGKED